MISKNLPDVDFHRFLESGITESVFWFPKKFSKSASAISEKNCSQLKKYVSTYSMILMKKR